MNKKIIGIITLITLMIVGGIGYAVSNRDQSEEPVTNQQAPKKKVVRPVNVIPEDERAYMRIVPEPDGRNLTIQVAHLGKPADSVEHELEYQAGTLLQGLFYTLELNQLPATTTKLMGSCSAGGACTYHEDIKGGTLLAHFDGEEPYSLKSDWKYIDNLSRDTQVSSKDAKFQLESPLLANARYVVIYNSPGYPEEIPGQVQSDTYSFATSSTLTGEAELTMRARSEGNLAIAVYDGESWSVVEGQIDEADSKSITATVPLADAYTVISR